MSQFFIMAFIHNSDLTKELVDTVKLQVSKESVPNQIADKVVPVIDVNPKHSRIINFIKRAIATNSTAATVTTTLSDRDTFIFGFLLSVTKDVTSTSTYTRLTASIDGVVTIIGELSGFTLTVQDKSVSVILPRPIRIDRGTQIQLNNATNVANITSTATVYGYTVENVNA